MRVGIDLDNCVYPFVLAWQRYQGLPQIPARKWNFYEDHGYETVSFIRSYRQGVNDSFIFQWGDPIPGSQDAIHKLKAAGHTIHVATDRFVGEKAFGSTQEWLDKHGISYDSLTFTRDKTVVDVDVFLDDKPGHVDDLRQRGVRAFLFDCGREDQRGHPYLLPDWNSFVESVEEMELEYA